MNDWVSVRPGRSPKRTEAPAPAPARRAPAAGREPSCGDAATRAQVVPGRAEPTVRPRPELVLCSRCSGSGVTVGWSWSSSGTTIGGGSVPAGSAQRYPCHWCSGRGWVFPDAGLPFAPAPFAPQPWPLIGGGQVTYTTDTTPARPRA